VFESLSEQNTEYEEQIQQQNGMMTNLQNKIQVQEIEKEKYESNNKKLKKEKEVCFLKIDEQKIEIQDKQDLIQDQKNSLKDLNESLQEKVEETEKLTKTLKTTKSQYRTIIISVSASIVAINIIIGLTVWCWYRNSNRSNEIDESSEFVTTTIDENLASMLIRRMQDAESVERSREQQTHSPFHPIFANPTFRRIPQRAARLNDTSDV
jgi:chromosome segregation ATPase